MLCIPYNKINTFSDIMYVLNIFRHHSTLNINFIHTSFFFIIYFLLIWHVHNLLSYVKLLCCTGPEKREEFFPSRVGCRNVQNPDQHRKLHTVEWDYTIFILNWDCGCVCKKHTPKKGDAWWFFSSSKKHTMCTPKNEKKQKKIKIHIFWRLWCVMGGWLEI